MGGAGLARAGAGAGGRFASIGGGAGAEVVPVVGAMGRFGGLADAKGVRVARVARRNVANQHLLSVAKRCAVEPFARLFFSALQDQGRVTGGGAPRAAGANGVLVLLDMGSDRERQ